MRPKATSKFLRAVLVAAVLVIALAGGALDKSGRVGAKSCDDAWTEYFSASFAYENARISYFYGQPVSCDSQCLQASDIPKCIEDCRTLRRTALGVASIGLFNLALDTCTPATMNECAQAQTMANNCLYQHNSANYSDPEEAAAVADQYWACIEASKIDSCR